MEIISIDEDLYEEENPEAELEKLPPDEIAPLVANRIAQLEQVFNKVSGAQARLLRDMPTSHLRVDRLGKYVRYYHLQEKGDTHGVYIPKKNRKLACKLAQKEYNARLLHVIQMQIAVLRQLEEDYIPKQLDDAFEGMHECKQPLVEPVRLSDDAFAHQWQKASFRPKSFKQDVPEHYTSGGLRVRSKSEVLIAETLARKNVPFKYECPCRVRGLGKVHPDFTCINLRTRKKILWEHFGMMDSKEYCIKAVARINRYSAAGFNLGKNLIATFETSADQLNVRTVERLAELYLK